MHPRLPRAPRSKKPLILLALAVAAAAWWCYAHEENTKVALPPVLVSVAPAAVRDVPLSIPAVGTVVTYQSVAVRSRLDSQIMAVKFHDGDEVNQGQVLFQLDDRELKAQLEQQEAARARDEASLENLRVQYERQKALAAKQYAAQADLDAAKAAYEAGRATVAADAAAAQDIRVQLQYMTITSPISGRAGTIAVTLGNNVKANDVPLVTINQMKPIRVQVSLPQQYLSAVRDAMAAGSVTAEAQKQGGGAIGGGTLDYIDNNVDLSTGTFAARARFENADEALWPGMFVNITLTLGDEKHVLTVPEVAIQHGQSGDFVFVIDGGKAHKRPVKVLRLQGDVAVISEGVKEGEQVATDGLMNLRDGSEVKVQEPAAQKPAS